MRWLLLPLLAACGRPAPAPATPDAPPPPTTHPVLLVANKADATLSVLELPDGRAIATLPTEIGPHEIAVSPDGKRVVVTSYGDQVTFGRALTVVDLPSLSVAKTIDLGEFRRPHGIAFLPDGKRVVVTAEVNAAVLVVDVDTGAVSSISTSQQGTHMLALAPDGTRAYTANIGSGTLTAIDLVAMRASEPVAGVPMSEAIAITPDGKEVWTASLQNHRIAIFDAPMLTAGATLAGAGTPIRITPTPDGTSMIVSNASASSIQIVDVATRAIETIATPPLAGASAVPVGSVVASDSKTAYVALVAEDRVAVIDLASRAIVGHLPTGRGPDGLGYSTAFVPR
ncbi:MAG: beta-propeller fold lactonase family protein [Deltaproteobacteria bacterium]|nr:beta-propeller fold lactonase family protein [Deltaproteobacteria bacterium]